MKRLTEYTFTKEERVALRRFLGGKAGTRPTAKTLKCSHTQVINIVTKLAREAFQRGIKIV